MGDVAAIDKEALRSSTSIMPTNTGSGSAAVAGADGCSSGASAMTDIGTKPVKSPDRNCLRQVESWPLLIPHIRHAKVGDEPGATLCARTRSFSSVLQRRRRSGPLKTSPLTSVEFV